MVMTILPPDADPIATLRTMAAFGMDERRGIAEIKDGWQHPLKDTVSNVVGPTGIIGLAILCMNPEKTPIPIFDTATRTVEVTMLADWLKARGYEAAACRWNRKGTAAGDYLRPPDIAWELVTGPAEVPKMPPEFPTGPNLTATEVAMRQAELRQRIMARGMITFTGQK